MAAALKGSPDAFRALVERFQRPVLGLIRRMVHDHQLAEDLAQETFVRAFENLASFEPDRAFSSWLFKIAHNRTIDHLRRKRHLQVPLEIGDPDDGPTREFLATSEHLSPDRQAASTEMAGALEAALRRLRPNYREVLALRFQGDMSYQEVADCLGVSMNGVKVLIHRARKQLIQELQKLGVTGELPS